MSKTSHAKHEHNTNESSHGSDSIPNEDFSKHHKGLIWAVIIILVVVLPILFAALSLLHILSW